MKIFLILMYLLSLALGYAAAFRVFTQVLWRSIRSDDMPFALQSALNPLRQRVLLYAAYSAASVGIGYGFWQFGLVPGAGIASCFIMASKISEMFLLHRMHNAFHLNLILNTLFRTQADYLKAGDMVHANAMHPLIEKVELKLCAVKVIKSATMVPAYDGNIEHLKVPEVKADSYHRCTRTEKA